MAVSISDAYHKLRVLERALCFVLVVAAATAIRDSRLFQVCREDRNRLDLNHGLARPVKLSVIYHLVQIVALHCIVQ